MLVSFLKQNLPALLQTWGKLRLIFQEKFEIIINGSKGNNSNLIIVWKEMPSEVYCGNLSVLLHDV